MELVFLPDKKQIKVSKGSRIIDVIQHNNIELSSLCGGKGLCGKCKIIIITKEENLSTITKEERKLLSKEQLLNNYRLACQTHILGDATIIIPKESRVGQQRLQIEGTEKKVEMIPNIVKRFIKLPKPSLKDQRSDATRLIDLLEEQYSIHPQIDQGLLYKLPQIIRNAKWEITITTIDDKIIINIEEGHNLNDAFGLALDIGTTKIALYLLNLKTGRIIHSDAMINPQIVIGEDILSRLSYVINNDSNLMMAQHMLIEGINKLIKKTCLKFNIKNKNIYEMTIVGNTAMHHLALKLNPQYLSVSPYTPVINDSLDIKASCLNININTKGNIHVLPNIAAFVGSDCVAGILATEIHQSNSLCFFVDIGTNTEIVIGNKDELFTCSCASGPAFEGVHIKHGMRAREGAIERIKIHPDSFKSDYVTIGDTNPIGICGSGIIDALSEMFKVGIVNREGRIKAHNHPRIRKKKNSVEYVLEWKEDTGLNEDIVITQADVREIQKAKAAIYSGASILINTMRIKPEDIKKVYIAGAFGTYVNIESAVTIGMIPDFPLEKIIHVGNSAGTGARMTLLSKKARDTAKKIVKKTHYIELANDPNFYNEYMNALYIPNADTNKFLKTLTRLKLHNNKYINS